MAYGFFLAVYLLAWAGFFLVLRELNIAWPRAIEGMDLLLLSLATFRLTNVLTEEKVAACLRSPFCEVRRTKKPDGTHETEEVPRGTGIRRVAGELILCSWCMGIWIATLSTFFFVLLPGAARIVLLAFSVAAAGLIFQVLTKLLDKTRHTLPQLVEDENEDEDEDEDERVKDERSRIPAAA